MTTTTGRATNPAAPSRPETLADTWQNRSGCYNRPEGWWDGDDAELTAKARAVCVGCPVFAECLGEQMWLEEDHKWSRPLVRAGLTGAQRVELFMDEKVDGPYDAEEARLLALESAAYGKPVREVAEGGVSVSTLRLAARLAGERVPARKVLEADKGSGLERALKKAVEIMAWRDEGVSQRQICSGMGLPRTPVITVIGAYSRLIGEIASTTSDEADASTGQDTAHPLTGDATIADKDQERLQTIVSSVAQGMSYPQIDRVQGYATNSTAQFISRMRKKYARAGMEFPIKLRTRSLKDEDVVRMRELYAAGGVTDLELGLRFGVERKVVTDALSGRRYKDVGGPIRVGRTADSKKASKAAMDEVCQVAFRSGREKQMEKAA